MDHLAGNLIISIVAGFLLAILIRSRLARHRWAPVGRVLSGPFEMIVDGNIIDTRQTPIIEWPTEPQVLIPHMVLPMHTGIIEMIRRRDVMGVYAWRKRTIYNTYKQRYFNTYGKDYHRD